MTIYHTITMNKIINGKNMANEIKEELKSKILVMKTEHNVVPTLAVVLVGCRADSSTYVRMKRQAASEIGMNFILKEFDTSISQNDLIQEVRMLNNDTNVNGLIVQLPLPSHINENMILNEVSYEKDIDGFHPLNIGNLCMKDRNPMFIPCTPKGCMTILERIGVKLDGKHVVVIGRSNIVGIPVAMLCLHKNATITICHSHTKNIEDVVRNGDIVIAAVGRPMMVKKEWLKEGCIVLDVGINSIEVEGGKKKLVGDVDTEDVKEVVARITPVPCGIGPMTVISLLENTYNAALVQLNSKKM